MTYGLRNHDRTSVFVEVTGATILAAAQHIPVIEGIERTALATIYPTAKFEKSKRRNCRTAT